MIRNQRPGAAAGSAAAPDLVGLAEDIGTAAAPSGRRLCPYCPAELMILDRRWRPGPPWLACPCCGCMWNGDLDPANQINSLAWIPACFHPVVT